MALKKAEHIAKSHDGSVVIGADTAVFADGQMLGKPADEKDAEKMLAALSGKTHKVITGCAIVKGEKKKSFSVISEVTFYKLTENEIKEYVGTKEPLDKAGAYGIQDNDKYPIVKSYEGSYDNIVGFPVKEIKDTLESM